MTAARQQVYDLFVLVHGSIWSGSRGGSSQLWPPIAGQKESGRRNGSANKEKRG